MLIERWIRRKHTLPSAVVELHRSQNQPTIMRTSITVIVLLLSLTKPALASDYPFFLLPAWTNAPAPGNFVIRPNPVLNILPEDVNQASIRVKDVGRSGFAVLWIYTESGAKKSLAFREAHAGRKSITEVGIYQTQPTVTTRLQEPPFFSSYNEWKRGWLRNPLDKIWGVSEKDAKAIASGLRNR